MGRHLRLGLRRIPGIYIGACQDCNARVHAATMEDNALGYSGSNAGGRLENSTYRHNLVGIAPNSENPGDGPPPQDGECGRPNINTETRADHHQDGHHSLHDHPQQPDHRKQQPQCAGQRDPTEDCAWGAGVDSRATTPIWWKAT